MRLSRTWIESRIPHQGRMCLLDEVLDWSAARIRCRTATHRDTGNPLRARGRLGIACGIEYAAQTMAVHGALAADASADGEAHEHAGVLRPRPRPRAGFLAAVRGVQFHARHLDDVPGDLLCEALWVAGDAGSALYEFTVESETACLLSGRATVVLDAAPWMHP